MIRSLTRVSAFCLALICMPALATAQTSYTWTATGHQQLWEADAGGTTPGLNWDQSESPGSLLNGSGATNDAVFLINNRAGATNNGNSNVQIRLATDAGTIGSLQLGGSTIDGFTYTTLFQIRDSGNLDVTGDVTLGGLSLDGVTERGGRLELNNQNATMSIGGNIVSSGGNTENRIIIDGNTSGGLTLTGNIDTAGTREIDLFINRGNKFITTAGASFNVDNFRVGTGFGVNKTGRSYTLDGGRTINANSANIGLAEGNNTSDTNTNTVSSTFSINNATTTTSGSMVIGSAASGVTTRQLIADGTVNVGANGTLDVGGTLRLGAMNNLTVNANTSSTGTVNLNDATSSVSTGQVHVGADLRGTGTLNINAGTLTAGGAIYMGGNDTNGNDSDTSGTINVLSGGSLINSGGNIEVGRGGLGTLNVDGGTVTMNSNNLVLGQTATGGSTQSARGTVSFTNGALVSVGNGTTNNDLNFNRGGGTVVQDGAATVVSISRNINMADAGGSFNSSYTLNEGTLNVGNVINVASFSAAEATVTINGGTLNLVNSLTGSNGAGTATVNFNGGDINIGSSGGATRSLNLGNGAGSMTVNITGGDIDIDNNLDYRFGTGSDLLTISGGTLTIVNNLDMDGGSTVGANQLTIDGSGATIEVGNNLLLDTSSVLNFNLDSGGVTMIDAVGEMTLAGAEINFDFSALSTTIGDIDLIRAQAEDFNAFSDSFGNFAFGDTVHQFGDDTFYRLAVKEGSTVIYLQAIPEPSSGLLAAATCAGLLFRRRRK